MARKSDLQMLADDIATRWLALPGESLGDRALVRDYCDEKTGGELDCIQLDILADMVEARLASAAEHDRLHAAERRRHGH